MMGWEDIYTKLMKMLDEDSRHLPDGDYRSLLEEIAADIDGRLSALEEEGK